jgi:hypothetical protein
MYQVTKAIYKTRLAIIFIIKLAQQYLLYIPDHCTSVNYGVRKHVTLENKFNAHTRITFLLSLIILNHAFHRYHYIVIYMYLVNLNRPFKRSFNLLLCPCVFMLLASPSKISFLSSLEAPFNFSIYLYHHTIVNMILKNNEGRISLTYTGGRMTSLAMLHSIMGV